MNSEDREPAEPAAAGAGAGAGWGAGKPHRADAFREAAPSPPQHPVPLRLLLPASSVTGFLLESSRASTFSHKSWSGRLRPVKVLLNSLKLPI